MFAKDSMLDLASLTKKSSSSLSELPAKEGESSQVKVVVSGDSDQDLTSLDNKKSIASSDAATGEAVDDEPSTGVGTSEDSASVEQTQEAGSQSSYGQYSGFQADYYAGYGGEDIAYDHDPYAPTIFGGQGGKKGDNIWCCLFPWFANKKAVDEESESSVHTNGSLKRSLSKDDDDLSTGSGVYGEKLTDKDRMAVLARLRLPQSDQELNARAATPPSTKKGLLDDINPGETKDPKVMNGLHGADEKPSANADEPMSGPPKGILKRHGSFKTRPPRKEKASPSKVSQGPSTPRRSLFPSAETRNSPHAAKNVRFSPMARVMAIKSRKDMTFLEKSWIWWQKSDYESFKKAGRIIAKAILEGGGEVWLTSSSSFGSVPSRAGANQRSFHMTGRDPDLRSHEAGIELSSDDFGDKWWCKFGHSRRGLEHIASMDEGRQRQQNVRASIRAVLAEQRKQRIQGIEDAEKLRSTSLRHTTWARDLSLAAGSADAEAVKTEFSRDAKSREFYLLKQSRSNSGTGRQVPSFMMPTGTTSLSLDANTSTQIRMRRNKVAPMPQPNTKKEPMNGLTLEAVHDHAENQDSLSKKAAGFGTEEADMSAILSGMGAVAKDKEMVVQPQQAKVGVH
jgi:hypothetical protein